MAELDFSDPNPDDHQALSRDRIPVRSMREDDLAAIIGLDRRLTGRDRSAYYQRKAQEALAESGVRVSLVAEQDGRLVGFVMARVDFGEFGRTEPEAVIDTIGVDAAWKHRSIGTALLSQLLVNLAGLQVERVRTEVLWDDFGLIAFLERCGFAPSQRLAVARPVENFVL
jgi:ribosomal protein S18 acetylase RimI-like enzyme